MSACCLRRAAMVPPVSTRKAPTTVRAPRVTKAVIVSSTPMTAPLVRFYFFP